MFYVFDSGLISVENKCVKWKIYNFFSLRLVVGCEIRSPEFSFNDTSYSLIIWPRGKKGFGTEEWFGICLNRLDAHQCYGSVQLSIVNDLGDIRVCTVECSENGLYRRERFMEWLEFSANRHTTAPSGCLTVVCRMFNEDLQEEYEDSEENSDFLLKSPINCSNGSSKVKSEADKCTFSHSSKITSPFKSEFSEHPTSDLKLSRSSTINSFFDSSHASENSLETESLKPKTFACKTPSVAAELTTGKKQSEPIWSYVMRGLFGDSKEKKLETTEAVQKINAENEVENNAKDDSSIEKESVIEIANIVNQQDHHESKIMNQRMRETYLKKIKEINQIEKQLNQIEEQWNQTEESVNQFANSLQNLKFSERTDTLIASNTSAIFFSEPKIATCSESLLTPVQSETGTGSAQLEKHSASALSYPNGEKECGKTDLTARREVSTQTETGAGERECGKTDLTAHLEASTQTGTEVGVRKLLHDLEDILANGSLSDVTVNVKDQEFKVHRCILAARSPVFLAMMTHDTKEKASGIVTIEDADPDVFSSFLHYLYSGTVKNLTSENVMSLYTTADKYQVQGVKDVCRNHMLKNISVENFCDVLTLSIRHEEKELTDAATKFFMRNSMEIVLTCNWQTFLSEHPVAGNELFIKQLQLYRQLQP